MTFVFTKTVDQFHRIRLAFHLSTAFICFGNVYNNNHVILDAAWSSKINASSWTLRESVSSAVGCGKVFQQVLKGRLCFFVEIDLKVR